MALIPLRLILYFTSLACCIGSYTLVIFSSFCEAREVERILAVWEIRGILVWLYPPAGLEPAGGYRAAFLTQLSFRLGVMDES